MRCVRRGEREERRRGEASDDLHVPGLWVRGVECEKYDQPALTSAASTSECGKKESRTHLLVCAVYDCLGQMHGLTMQGGKGARQETKVRESAGDTAQC